MKYYTGHGKWLLQLFSWIYGVIVKPNNSTHRGHSHTIQVMEYWQTHHAKLKAHTWHHYNLKGVLVRADKKDIRVTEGFFCTSDIKVSDQALLTMVYWHHHRSISEPKLVIPKWG